MLPIDWSKSKVDKNLYEIPHTLTSTSLEKEALHLLSKKNPKKFNFILKTLSQWPIITIADVEAVVNYLLQGKSLSIVDPTMGIFGELIDRFKAVIGLNRNYGITYNCATNALNAAYRACGLKRGDTVVGVGYTYHATVTPTVELGANIILTDADPEDGNVTYAIIRQTIKAYPETKIVAVNHNWGTPIREILQIKAFLADRSIRLIEDCSHAHGSKIDGIPVGSFGDISIFSLQANKTLTAGEGGLCFTDELELKKRLLLVGHEDTREATYTCNIDPSVRQTGLHGFQFRMHPLAAALAISQLSRLEEVIQNRRENFNHFRERLKEVAYLHFPNLPTNILSNYYSIRVAYDPYTNQGVDIHQFVAYLKNLGIPIAVDSSGPLARKSIYQRNWPEYGSQALSNRRFFTPDQFPGINAYCQNRLVFPVFSRSPSLIKNIIDVIADHIIHFNYSPQL